MTTTIIVRTEPDGTASWEVLMGFESDPLKHHRVMSGKAMTFDEADRAAQRYVASVELEAKYGREAVDWLKGFDVW